MASAVAAPIPRLAPVTTATRPRSQCAGSPMVCRPGDGPDYLPVEPLVSVQALFQVEMALGMVTAVRARDPGRPPDGLRSSGDVIGRHQETSHTVRDHLTEGPASERPDRSSARLRLGGRHP